MRKHMMHIGIAGIILAVGLVFAGCATLGTSQYDPPDGIYRNGSQGDIVFDSRAGTWEATSLGYKGSFEFNGASSMITLTAEQQLQGLRWTDIDPIRSFSSGQIKGTTLTLGDFHFYHMKYDSALVYG
jgi:hypothetical protein